MKKFIAIPFNWKIVVFLIIIEVVTIPFVAISNSLIIKNLLYMSLIGFSVAFVALICIFRGLSLIIKNYFTQLLCEPVIKINGLLYISLIAGFLLMFMFYLQSLTYHFTNSDCIVGLVSAFFSVSISLVIYHLGVHYFNYGIKLITNSNSYTIQIIIKDIVILTLLFSLYETIVSPMSLLWVPHHQHRFIWGIITGVVSGLSGGLPLLVLCYFTKYNITLKLVCLASKID